MRARGYRCPAQDPRHRGPPRPPPPPLLVPLAVMVQVSPDPRAGDRRRAHSARRARLASRWRPPNPRVSRVKPSSTAAAAGYPVDGSLVSGIVAWASPAPVPPPPPPPLLLAMKVAVTAGAPRTCTVQLPVPEQPPPDHPAKTEPGTAVAISFTLVPARKRCEQLVPQWIPAGRLVTVPVPLVELIDNPSAQRKTLATARHHLRPGLLASTTRRRASTPRRIATSILIHVSRGSPVRRMSIGQLVTKAGAPRELEPFPGSTPVRSWSKRLRLEA